MDHVTLVTPFQGPSVVRRLTIDIACKHTKFDDLTKISLSEDISGGVKF